MKARETFSKLSEEHPEVRSSIIATLEQSGNAIVNEVIEHWTDPTDILMDIIAEVLEQFTTGDEDTDNDLANDLASTITFKVSIGPEAQEILQAYPSLKAKPAKVGAQL